MSLCVKEMKAAESFASHPSSFHSLVSVLQTNANAEASSPLPAAWEWSWRSGEIPCDRRSDQSTSIVADEDRTRRMTPKWARGGINSKRNPGDGETFQGKTLNVLFWCSEKLRLNFFSDEFFVFWYHNFIHHPADIIWINVGSRAQPSRVNDVIIWMMSHMYPYHQLHLITVIIPLIASCCHRSHPLVISSFRPFVSMSAAYRCFVSNAIRATWET